MRRFLPDTSCLVAAVCSWHEHHPATVEELVRRAKRREETVMAAPALIETYSVLTRLPPPYRLRPVDDLPGEDCAIWRGQLSARARRLEDR